MPAVTVAIFYRTEFSISRRCHREARVGPTSNRSATFRVLYSWLFRGNLPPADFWYILWLPKREEIRFIPAAGSLRLRTTLTGLPWLDGCVVFERELLLSLRREQ